MNRRALFALVPAAGAALAAAASSPAAASSSSGEKSAAPTNSYIRFPVLTASIVRRDGRRGVMTVEAGIDVKDEALRLKASQDTPRLRAAYNDVVQRAAAGIAPGGPPNIERLHRDLQLATARTLGRGGAVFLIGSVTVL